MTSTNSILPMTAAELTRKVLQREKLLILDVRSESDFRKWKIEGEQIDSINIPYFELMDDVEPALEQIPTEEPVLVVCAKEGSSILVAGLLAEAGRDNVYYLQGGMKAWNEHVEPVKVGDLTGGGAIYQFIRIGKGCLSYMIISGKEAAVVDAPRMTEVFEQFAGKQGVMIKHTVDTHLHADHISGGRKLAEPYKGTYWLPPKDAVEVNFDYTPLEEGQTIQLGSAVIRMEALYSPGHTIGSTSLIIDDHYLLTGDSLFIESIGRPDLAGQAEDWVEDLRETLYGRFRQLSSEMVILPAHFGHPSELGDEGKVTATLGELFESNRGLNIVDAAEFRRQVTDYLPEQPNAYQEIRQTNMGLKYPSDEEQREMETGPNRCAVHDR